MKIVVFFSGTGTNLKSILEHQNQFDYEVCACFTNNPEAKGLIFCKEYGINCKIINHKDFDDREEYDGVVNSFLENLNRRTPLNKRNICQLDLVKDHDQ